MTTSIRILRQEMKWTEGGTSGGGGCRRRGEELYRVSRGEERRGCSWALCQDAMLCFSPSLRWKFPRTQRCVCVCLCPVHLTSLNSNNVFPHINMLWIRAHIIDPPAQPYCCPRSTPFTAPSSPAASPPFPPLHHWGLGDFLFYRFCHCCSWENK